MSKSDAGKGDRPRPCNKKLYDENYDRIFGKPKKKRNIRDGCAFGETCHYTCGDCLIGEVIEVIG